MGNGISINDSDKKSDISRQLREKYEECMLHGASDNELRAKLTDQYNQWMESYMKAEELKASLMHAEELASKVAGLQNTSIDTKSDKLTGPKLCKPSLDDKIKETHKKVAKLTRRRSFDQRHSKVALKIEETPVAATDVVIAEPHDEQDHWDSVAAQPYCDICAMAFKSPAFLERHIKFSDIHLRNVAAAESAAAALLRHQDAVVDAPHKPMEGIDYKLIYSGTKLFWRTREEMDVSIYVHMKLSIVEIISHDLVRNKDFKRIYMNHSVLLDLLQSSLESQIGGDVDKALSRYLISRMQLVKVDGEQSIIFVPSQTDPIRDDLIIDKLPEHFVGVSVARRRRTNGEEIDAMIQAMEHDRAALSVALHKADSISLL